MRLRGGVVVEKPNVEIEIHSAAACIVTLRGEHDPSTMGQIAGVLNVASAHRHVLVDLSECSFLDSTVVRTLLLAAELAGERGGALEFVAAARSGNAVRRALEVMRVDAVVAVHASRAAGSHALPVRARGRSARPSTTPVPKRSMCPSATALRATTCPRNAKAASTPLCRQVECHPVRASELAPEVALAPSAPG